MRFPCSAPFLSALSMPSTWLFWRQWAKVLTARRFTGTAAAISRSWVPEVPVSLPPWQRPNAERKASSFWKNKALGLLSSGGAVTGVQVENADGSTYTLKARAVVIATGGLHGANRLGGNGVADIVVNGRLAGEAAARY